ncbi:MAG: c-type cytochrome [Chitinophagaceae bacterium]|nr:c-type cytochrome [Chitinophagaceae bacterium]MCB9047429.1 c-type cytochrome [Chitinophagales bacterium]
MRKYFNKHTLLSAVVALSPTMVFGADAAAGGSTFNPVLIGLLTLIIVLLFVIGMMGSTIVQLGYAYRNKMRKERSNNSGAVKTLLLLLAASTLSFSAMAQDAVEAAAPKVTSIGGLPVVEFYVLISTVILELLIIMTLILITNILIKAITQKSIDEVYVPKAAHKVSFWDKFNNAVEIEKEQDILLDHNYDGIEELDNSLPPWWKYGFYLTIVIGVIYLWYYHAGGNGPSQVEEYQAEVKRGEEQVAAYLAKSANNVDENSVVMLDAAGIAEGQNLFSKNCIACHAADGGGNAVGPNLTDQYWLHGGGVQNIFKSIKYGWKDKGMKSWKDDFSPRQIAELASFVWSLQGTTPAAPKPKQGELYIEAEDNNNTDSTQADKPADKEVAAE